MHPIARLLELIGALDRRIPRPERRGEPAIARASAELREEAVAQLARLEENNQN